jgi:hypothetical protein
MSQLCFQDHHLQQFLNYYVFLFSVAAETCVNSIATLCGSVSSEPLPNNGCLCGGPLTAHFRRSGIMSQYNASYKADTGARYKTQEQGLCGKTNRASKGRTKGRGTDESV